MQSFTAADTFFHIVVSETPVTVDGFALGEPTGEVECEECGAIAENIDEIPHDADCSQRFVHSAWYLDSAQNA